MVIRVIHLSVCIQHGTQIGTYCQNSNVAAGLGEAVLFIQTVFRHKGIKKAPQTGQNTENNNINIRALCKALT